MASVGHILVILAQSYANNYRHWSSLGKPIDAKWWSANNLQYRCSLGKTISRHYGNLVINWHLSTKLYNLVYDRSAVVVVVASVFTWGYHKLSVLFSYIEKHLFLFIVVIQSRAYM